jgi:hypothetical protein
MKWDREMRREREKHAGDDSVDFIKRFFDCFPVLTAQVKESQSSSFFSQSPHRHV